ncbi:MAG TPA: hypothetical protein DEB31_09800 [Clostridiales bacterium]|nr:hypothetical protein [Clostridiales bacterium]
MKTVAFIPIKLNNERLPGKNIKKLYDGTPLIHLIQKACLAARHIDEVYVFCSDTAIQEYLLDGILFLQRPAWLDGNTVTVNQLITEFMKLVDAGIYIMTHATAPFATAKSFEVCIEKVASGEFDSAFCASKIQSFLWKDGAPLNYDPGNVPRTQDLVPLYKESSNAYVFTKSLFVEYGRRVGFNPFLYITGEIEAFDIDNPEDFEIANLLYKELAGK